MGTAVPRRRHTVCFVGLLLLANIVASPLAEATAPAPLSVNDVSTTSQAQTCHALESGSAPETGDTESPCCEKMRCFCLIVPAGTTLASMPPVPVPLAAAPAMALRTKFHPRLLVEFPLRPPDA